METTSLDPKIAFVIPYFGQWPRFWPLWVESVAANPQIDFLLLTDLPKPAPLPPNVRLIEMPYGDLMRRLSLVMGIDLPRASGHKLCDYRPFFGLAFSDLLEPYAYWGYCDLDLIFGSLAPVQEYVRSGRYDFISPWDYTVGYCTLLRNVERVNRICFEIQDWETRACHHSSTSMDEGGISLAAVTAGGFTFGVLDNVREGWREPQALLGATVKIEGTLCGLDGWFIAHYKNGRMRVYAKDLPSREVVYFHFMGLKAERYWRRLPECHPKILSFTPYGPVPGLLDPEQLRSLSFRWRCFRTHLPRFLYRLVRDRAPERAIVWVKERKRALRGTFGEILSAGDDFVDARASAFNKVQPVPAGGRNRFNQKQPEST